MEFYNNDGEKYVVEYRSRPIVHKNCMGRYVLANGLCHAPNLNGSIIEIDSFLEKKELISTIIEEIYHAFHFEKSEQKTKCFVKVLSSAISQNYTINNYFPPHWVSVKRVCDCTEYEYEQLIKLSYSKNEYKSPMITYLEKSKKTKNNQVIIYRIDNQIVGWALFLKNCTDLDGVKRNVVMMFVAPRQRKKGVGENLLIRGLYHIFGLETPFTVYPAKGNKRFFSKIKLKYPFLNMDIAKYFNLP